MTDLWCICVCCVVCNIRCTTTVIMMTSWNGNIFRVTGLCEGDPPVPLTKANDADLWWFFFFICAWTNGWANNRDAGDMRRHWGQYDVTVMETFIFSWNEILHWNIGLCNTPLHGRIVRHSHEVPTEVCLSKANGHERRWYIRNAFSLVKALLKTYHDWKLKWFEWWRDWLNFALRPWELVTTNVGRREVNLAPMVVMSDRNVISRTIVTLLN